MRAYKIAVAIIVGQAVSTLIHHVLLRKTKLLDAPYKKLGEEFYAKANGRR
jgi:hypothetical protein